GPFLEERLDTRGLAAKESGETGGRVGPERLKVVVAERHASPRERLDLTADDLLEARSAIREWRVIGRRRAPVASLEDVPHRERHPAAQARGGVADADPARVEDAELDGRTGRPPVGEAEAVGAR